MKHLILGFLAIFLFAATIQAQDDGEVKIKKEKKIILKVVDEDGKIVTKVIEDDGEEEIIESENIWITEKGDSIDIEIEIEEGEEGIKKIKKRIFIPDMEDLEGLEDLEELKNIEIFEFEGDDFKEPHMWHLRKGEEHGPHGKDVFIWRGMDGGEKKAQLGVYIEDHPKGVKVKDVIENSSAWSVGIFPGDVIYEINNKKMTNMEELVREVSSHEPGDFIKVELRRNGKKKSFDVRLQGEQSPMHFAPKMMKPHLNKFFDEGKEYMFKMQEDANHVKEKCKDKAYEIEKEVKMEMKKQQEEIKDLQKRLEKNVKDKEKFMHKREIPLSKEDEN